jgi:hypothetical protein
MQTNQKELSAALTKLNQSLAKQTYQPQILHPAYRLALREVFVLVAKELKEKKYANN